MATLLKNAAAYLADFQKTAVGHLGFLLPVAMTESLLSAAGSRGGTATYGRFRPLSAP